MSNGSKNSKDTAAENLCLACGLCCNGVIFARVQLQLVDDTSRLQSLGLPLAQASGQNPRVGLRPRQFPQPCAALEGCRCRIYPERPVYCRQFECVLLKSVNAGRTSAATALGIIRTARERAEKVRRLLQALGDTEEGLALSARFRRMAKRLEKADLDEQTAESFGELTLAVQDLNFLLSEAFYPGTIVETKNPQSVGSRGRE